VELPRYEGPQGAFFIIGGNIGAGKSTCSKALADTWGFTPFYEAVEDNPFMEGFYRDFQGAMNILLRDGGEGEDLRVSPSDNATLLQTAFMLNRGFAHQTASSSPENCVQDRSLFEDRYVFAEVLTDLGIISGGDFSKYKRLFDFAQRDLKKPDLFVALEAGRELLTERITKRGREMERFLLDPQVGYLDRLSVKYEELYSMLETRGWNVLRISMDGIDLESRVEDRVKFFDMINDSLRK
jgi:deoxyadenosine/deoxycytidine kinase